MWGRVALCLFVVTLTLGVSGNLIGSSAVDNSKILCTTSDNAGNVYIGTQNGNVWMYAEEPFDWIKLTLGTISPSPRPIDKLFFDAYDHLHIFTASELWRYNATSNTVVKIGSCLSGHEGLWATGGTYFTFYSSSNTFYFKEVSLVDCTLTTLYSTYVGSSSTGSRMIDIVRDEARGTTYFGVTVGGSYPIYPIVYAFDEASETVSTLGGGSVILTTSPTLSLAVDSAGTVLASLSSGLYGCKVGRNWRALDKTTGIKFRVYNNVVYGDDNTNIMRYYNNTWFKLAPPLAHMDWLLSSINNFYVITTSSSLNNIALLDRITNAWVNIG